MAGLAKPTASPKIAIADKVFLINRPWNKNFTTADKCVRIDWEDIADLPNGDLSEFAGRELAHVKCGEKT